MKATGIVKKILANYEGETPGVKGKLCQMLMHGQAGRHRQDDHPAGRPGLRAWSGPVVRAEPAGL